MNGERLDSQSQVSGGQSQVSDGLARILNSKRVVVCVGSGGVGKTTVAASLGFRAALEGRKVLILTIDPARRLANSLGLSMQGNVETRIDPERFAGQGLTPRGELWAMTLDLRRTWDDLVTRYAPDEERRERILQNRLYQQVSTTLAGSLEYMAMEKVYELSRNRDYDLLVLDTPPTAHALDFLDAPNRMLDLVDNEAAKLLMVPALAAGKLGLNLFNFGSSFIVKGLARFTGVELLRDLADFLSSFQGMYDGFKQRAAATKALLTGDESAFVLVTSAQAHVVEEAVFFAEELRREQIEVSAVICNRVHVDPTERGGARDAQEIALALANARVPNESRAALEGHEGLPLLSERLARSIGDLARIARSDRAEIERLRTVTGTETPLYLVPRFDRDVYDLGGLGMIARELFENGESEGG